jgi:hypothetical protein
MELVRKYGVTYAVIGAMGGLPDPEPGYTSPASLRFKRGSFGWLDLDLDEAGLALTIRSAGGAPLHEDFIAATRPRPTGSPGARIPGILRR